MTRIVTTTYRYKRPPGKRKPVALEVPAIVRKNGRRRDAAAEEKEEKCPRLSGPGQEDPTPASDDYKPAIVTIRRTPAKILPPGLLSETPEEHRRRGDAADALFQDDEAPDRREDMTQPTLPNRKPPVFVRCPVCGTEFRRTSGQRWCSRDCAQDAKRRPGGAPPKRLIAEKIQP